MELWMPEDKRRDCKIIKIGDLVLLLDPEI